VARSSADAPEIDRVVSLDTDQILTAGDQIAVDATNSDAFDLHSEPWK